MKFQLIRGHLRENRSKVIAGTVGVILISALLVFAALFRVDKIAVVGGSRYSIDEIKEMAMKNPLAKNTALITLFLSHMDMEEVPFLESFDLEVMGPHAIRIHVNEKEIIGYVTQQNNKFYFDKDGIVLEQLAMTEEEIQSLEGSSLETGQILQPDEDVQMIQMEESSESHDSTTMYRPALTDVPLITGLGEEQVKLGSAVKVEDTSVFNTILGIARIVEKYKIRPEQVHFDSECNITLVYENGNIHCDLGKDILLEEKITRVAAILPELSGYTGVLHLEDYSLDTKNIVFSKEDQDTLQKKLEEKNDAEAKKEEIQVLQPES